MCVWGGGMGGECGGCVVSVWSMGVHGKETVIHITVPDKRG